MKLSIMIVFVITLLGALTADVRGQASSLWPDRIFDGRALLQTQNMDPQPALVTRPDEKNPKLAMLYSLVLPGLGETYLGRPDRAKIFFAAEGAIWTSFAVFRIQGSHRKDLYKEFAEIHAGVPQRDDDTYYRTIGNFLGSDGPFSANETIRRQARALFPDDPSAQQQFFDENAYTGDDTWMWESEMLLDRYREMRSSSLSAFRRSELSLGLLVANRLISVLHTGLIGSRRNLAQADDQSRLFWTVEAGRFGPGGRITLTRSF